MKSVYIKEKLYMDEVAKMKNKLISLSPEKIIIDALKTWNSSEVLNKKKHEKLDDMKQQAIIALNEILNPNKTTTEINNIYKTKVNEYQTSTNLVIAIKEQEHQECNQLLNTIKDQNNDLTIQKSKMELETDKLLNQLSESKNSINKLNYKYRLIEKMMPLYDLVSTEFNTHDPISVIKDIQMRQSKEDECQIEISDLHDEISQAKNEKKKELQNQKKNVEELSKKLFKADLANKDKSEKYDEEVRDIKHEIEKNHKHKVRHLLMQNMISRLYNLLYPELHLEKGINKSTLLSKIIDDDFYPNSASNEELSRYIQNMILSSDRNKCGLLLRSTVAYSNMMLRKRIKEKVNAPYNSEFTFEEIEKLIKRNEDERKRMQKIIEVKQDKISADKELIEKLKREIRLQDDKYDELQKSVQKQFIERIKRSKERRNSSIQNNIIKWTYTNESKNNRISIQPMSTIIPNNNNDSNNNNTIKSKKKKQKKSMTEYLSDINNAYMKMKSNLPVSENENENDNKSKESERRRVDTETNVVVHNELNEGFKRLVDHTNRIFLYKTKSKYAIPTKTPIERIENKLSKLKRIQKADKKPTNVSENILNNLDIIIYSIQKEDKI